MCRFACWTIALATSLSWLGCELAPDEPEAEPLATIRGQLESFDSDFASVRRDLAAEGVSGQIRVVLSWFQFRNATQGVPTWVAAESVLPQADGTFRLPVVAPPPEDALFFGESEEDVGLAGPVAIGTLSAVVSDGAFDWARTVEDPNRAVVVGHEFGALQVYWAGREALNLTDDRDQDWLLARGLSRLEPLIPVAHVQRVIPESLTDAHIERADAPPAWLFCRTRPEPTAIVGADVLDDFPDAGTVACWSCGEHEYFRQECPELFELVCADCDRSAVEILATEVGPDWPCAPDDSTPCAIEGSTFCGVDSTRFECREGVWQRLESTDCTNRCDDS